MYNILKWNCRGSRNNIVYVFTRDHAARPVVPSSSRELYCILSYRNNQGRVAIFVTNNLPHEEVHLTTNLTGAVCIVKLGATCITFCSIYCIPALLAGKWSWATSLHTVINGEIDERTVEVTKWLILFCNPTWHFWMMLLQLLYCSR